MPAPSASRQTSSSRCASGEISPTGSVIALSAMRESRRRSSISVGNPVHDHRVRRDAERGREALVALGRRVAAVRLDVLVGDAVQLAHLDARLEVLGDEREGLGDECAGTRHSLDLGLGLADDHARASTDESDCWISRNTSSMARSAWMPTTLPRVER